ncbi:hypothetical protein K144316041_p21290 (plasmid) [Clostridium tetani]|uniref:CRISPR-associated helicase Cas3' n=1 Tax=Clostridium tetani TaxID=1513 RepID=UPI0029530DB8|nr:CRISPR-associated helicase Cas3' [Clostridium tetani]BDR74290.1 hypothetical protein K144316041_p21290 [Clostridium tetani]
MILSRPNEELNTHIELILKQYKEMNIKKGVDEIVKNIVNKLCNENKKIKNCKDIIYDLFIQSLVLHDEGKKNPFFQSYIGNEEYKDYKYGKINKHHAEISAIYYCIEMYNRYVITTKKRVLQEYLKDMILSFAYGIYKHHTSLDNLDKDKLIHDLINYYEKNTEQFINIDITNIEFLYRFKNRGILEYTNSYTYYLLFKFSYSILVTCDFMSVYNSNYTKQLIINTVEDKLKNKINKKFNDYNVIKSIRNYETNPSLPLSKLNRLRTEMFLESEKNIVLNKDKHLFYLEAPTGCGKSLTSLNLALQLFNEKHNNLYYIAPFNNIIEQTYKVMKDSFYEDTVIINSKEDVFISDTENINYDKDFLNMQMINYPISLISHIRFFDVLFSGSRIKNLMMPTLCNSILILDEIQSYKNNIWINMINTLKEFAEMLNLKIIIMSATLPKMDKLLEDNTYKIPDLITNRDYYYDFFKRRVEFDFDLLDKAKNTNEEVFKKIDDVINNTSKYRILIECLTVKKANEFYEEMKKYKKYGFMIFKITGNTNNLSRDFIIKTIQAKQNGKYKNKKIILIGTQCIEAGVDIDMDIGFKDISMLDSDEQFCGRIARNFKEIGVVYFFDIDNIELIYKGDYRIEKTLKNKEWRNVFKDKIFDVFYNRNYKWLIEEELDTYKKYKYNLEKLQYEQVNKDMKLIESENYLFLFICKYEDEEDSKSLLDEYFDIKELRMGFAEKQTKLIHIKKKLNKYIYNINIHKFKSDILLEKLNKNTYIVEDGEIYFDNLNDNQLTKGSTLNLDMFVSKISLFL